MDTEHLNFERHLLVKRCRMRTDECVMDRRYTAWKKNRKFGDVYGGRRWTKREDNIFKRCHSLKPPLPTDSLPILIEDNPSRDFFFPISAEEADEALKELPKHDYDGITHIWCRRAKKSEFENGELPWAEYIWGSGVKVVVLYPWPKTMNLTWKNKSSKKTLREFNRFGINIYKNSRGWLSKPTASQLRKLYIELLLYHEVGHHLELSNWGWSKANSKQSEEYANQYAIQKSATATLVFDRLVKRYAAKENRSEVKQRAQV